MVERGTACDLPGCSIKYDNFLKCMWKTVAKGNLAQWKAEFCAEGLRNGFTLGIDESKMHGHRWFKNYKSALEASAAVAKAIRKRVEVGKTLDLGVSSPELEAAVRARYHDGTACFPMSAVDKSIVSYAGEKRLASDHTRTGVNKATDMSSLSYSLETYKLIAAFLKSGYFMAVSDVDAAYTNLPLAPSIWRFFLSRFAPASSSSTYTPNHLYIHLFADFGTAGAPGTFKLFFEDVIMSMARSEEVVSVPTPIYVDDITFIDECAAVADGEMEDLHSFCAETCGVFFKVAKDRLAARRQFALGFWWDSTTLTRELDEEKLATYMLTFAEALTCNAMTLREMQSMLGKAGRAVMTLPPGARCLLVSMFALTAGLVLPWHRRRLTRKAKQDLRVLIDLLRLAKGKGYYALSHFVPGVSIATDASRSGSFSGGGFITSDGIYDFWTYGTRAARRLIDFLEGDTVSVAIRRLCPAWSGQIISFFVDNQSFERSGEAGRSRAERLNDILKEIFMLQITYNFVIKWFWIDTKRNRLSDHLSRNREDEFLRDAHGNGSEDSQSAWWHLLPHVVPRRLDDLVGRVRVLPEERGVITPLMVRQAAETRPPTAADAERRQNAVNGDQFSTLPEKKVLLHEMQYQPLWSQEVRGSTPGQRFCPTSAPTRPSSCPNSRRCHPSQSSSASSA